MLVALLVLYVLSIGPLAWMNNRGWIRREWHPILSWTHAPVMWTIDNKVPIIGRALDSYVRLWLPSEPPKTPEMKANRRSKRSPPKHAQPTSVQ